MNGILPPCCQLSTFFLYRTLLPVIISARPSQFLCHRSPQQCRTWCRRWYSKCHHISFWGLDKMTLSPSRVDRTSSRHRQAESGLQMTNIKPPTRQGTPVLSCSSWDELQRQQEPHMIYGSAIFPHPQGFRAGGCKQVSHNMGLPRQQVQDEWWLQARQGD